MELAKEVKEFFSTDRNKSRFCLAVDISRSTLDKRLKTPEKFKAIEIQTIRNFVKVEKVFN